MRTWGDHLARALMGAALGVFLAAPLLAQQDVRAARRAPAYDPAKETVLQGTVKQIAEGDAGTGLLGTHLILSTQGGDVDVQLGPPGVLRSGGMTFAAGDQVQVVGSMVDLEKGSVLLARQVKKGDQTLVLRNARGMPLRAPGGRAGAGRVTLVGRP